MKKKELKKRIKHLQQLTDCVISDNVRLMMRLGDIPQCKHEDKYPKQTMTSFPDIPAATPSQVEEAERRIFAKIAKTEGPESESELKENTISLEVGKKYEAGNGEILRCNQYDERNNLSQKYEMSSKYGRLYYSKEGRNCGCDRSWDIVSEVKE